ncbi:type VI secretion system contractile sheath large subunit [Aliikangiella sp. IMCC44359]|uniref:type VI secretion system contractile sheath large subunit n=1 Tax=Aliikangiella sp. IMCC44359 TaxID=3459125 RepID=UPI00403AD996
MPSVKSPLLSKNVNTQSAINLDALCTRSAFIVNLNQFLDEKNVKKALIYWLNEFSQKEKIKTTNDIIYAIQSAISSIDHKINDQLNEIIHHPKLQKLESSWRGLEYLVKEANSAKNTKIKLLDVSWAEVVKDMSRAIEFDQSQLFQKVYSEEYGTPGGEPYGVLLGDYEISHKISKKHPYDDISTLESLAEVAAAAFTPFIAAASCELFGLDDFSALGSPLRLEFVFAQKEYIKWRAFRNKVDSRFIGLTLPRMSMRLPYRTTPGSYKGIFFYEKTAQSDNKNCLWGNACYAFGGILLREFKNVGWFGHIRGVPRNQIGGGLVTNLVKNHFNTDPSDIIYKPFTEVIITDTLEREMSDLGFMPFCQCYDTPFAAFYSNQSVQKPPKFSSKEANINAKLSTMLQHILCASRMAHYIKVIIRDKVGSFMSASDCEAYIGKWIYKYTTGREDMDWEEQARFPLRDALVKVKEHPAKPGEYLCSIQLRPHYQLDQMISELELVTELTQKT